jgi:hypothetical protein
MARGFTIKETDIYKLILDELNDNAFYPTITFSLADWITNIDDIGNEKGLLINRYALKNERFDVVQTMDEATYSSTKNSFVAISIGSLYGEFTALNTIKDVVYDTMVEFLVCSDNIAVQKVITLALEEVRARFIQYQTTLDVSYVDLNTPSSATRITETLKIIMMSGTIDYGAYTQISGKQYLTYTLPITIQATNFGEFANQQKIYIGVDQILTGAVPTMFLLEPNEWHYGTASGTESVMLLPDKASATHLNEQEIKSIEKDRGFSFNMEVQMDLQDATVGALLRHFYKYSVQESLIQPIYTVIIDMYLYDTQTKTYILDSDLRMDRKMICTQNQPNDTLSKGEKIVYSLVFIPYYDVLAGD